MDERPDKEYQGIVLVDDSSTEPKSYKPVYYSSGQKGSFDDDVDRGKTSGGDLIARSRWLCRSQSLREITRIGTSMSKAQATRR